MTDKHALVCAPLIPEFDRESGSRRLWDIMSFLQEMGWSITFMAQFPSASERYIAEMRDRGIQIHVHFDRAAEQLLIQERFDLAILAFWSIAEVWLPTIRKLSPETRVIVDSVDLHFLRNARKIFQQQGKPTEGRALGSEYAADMIREMNAYAAADGVLAVSDKESALINDLTGDPLLAHHVADCEDIAPSKIPFENRNGIVFVGNFRHPPNRDAVAYLCNLVLPQLDPAVTIEHPVYIVGNGSHAAMPKYNNSLSHLRFVGWVPSIVPYLRSARVTVLPLLYGAGTKRKLVQALTVGTPAVSSSMGTEGLNLRDGQHVLVADDPVTFARSIERLLTDAALWNRLSRRGRSRIGRSHSRAVTREQFQRAIAQTLERRPKPVDVADALRLHRRGFNHPYDQMVASIQDVVQERVPLESTVLVINKGDDDLLRLGGRKGWHFPRARTGVYAGHYPAGSDDAVTHLEDLRGKGAEFLVVPATAHWWFDHYRDFKEHLDRQYRLEFNQPDICTIYSLEERAGSRNGAQTIHLDTSPRSAAPGGATPPMPVFGEFVIPEPAAGNGHKSPIALLATSHAAVEIPTLPPVREREDEPPLDPPRIETEYLVSRLVGTTGHLSALCIGVYLSDRQNHVEHLVSSLHSSNRVTVTQRWVGIGMTRPSDAVADVTVGRLTDGKPKYEILNEILASEDLDRYDYVLVMDDDILIPAGFVDTFLGLQHRLDFRLAQPARTLRSFTDLPIVIQQPGALARQTLFVEIGPAVSFHRSVYDLVFPFDLTSAMGWGYENVWSFQLAQRGNKMGVIDAVPVDHSLRKPVEHYNWEHADIGRTSYLRQHDHLPLDKCFQVLDLISLEEASRWTC